jgi:hypothetical protein
MPTTVPSRNSVLGLSDFAAITTKGRSSFCGARTASVISLQHLRASKPNHFRFGADFVEKLLLDWRSIG